MLKIKIVILFSLVLPFLSVQEAVSLGIHGKEYFRERHRIVIENEPSGRIFAVKDNGTTWEAIGRVLYPCQKINPRGYTASKWAKPSAVAATAVNAIHIKTGDNTLEAKGMVFSLVPFEMVNPPGYYSSFLSPDSSIYTDIKAGTSIFGEEYSPFVGNPVYFQRGATAETVLLNEEFVPMAGDRIIIRVLEPFVPPKAVVFENREGGNVLLVMSGDQEQVIGEVLKPVHGVGRFQGTKYAGVGRIRANHTGVIDISTSPVNKTGGFQIIPSNHALSPEMGNASRLTQWMVVAPVPGQEEFLEGMPPLFSNYLRPVYSDVALESSGWLNDVLRRYIVDVKIRGSNSWQPMPEFDIDPDPKKALPAWTADAISDVTHIRIFFPVEHR